MRKPDKTNAKKPKLLKIHFYFKSLRCDANKHPTYDDGESLVCYSKNKFRRRDALFTTGSC